MELHTEQLAAYMFYKLLQAALCLNISSNGSHFFPTASACCWKLKSLSSRMPRYLFTATLGISVLSILRVFK